MSSGEYEEMSSWPNPIQIETSAEIPRKNGSLVFNPERLVALKKDLMDKNLPNIIGSMSVTHYELPDKSTSYASIELDEMLNSELAENKKFVKTILNHAVGQLTDNLYEALRHLDFDEVTEEQRNDYDREKSIFNLNSETVQNFIASVKREKPKIKGLKKFSTEIEILNEWNQSLSVMKVQNYENKPPDEQRAEQKRIVGQKSALGDAVDTEDFRDMFRLWQLDVGKGTEQLSGEMSTFEEIVSWARNEDEGWYMRPIRGPIRGLKNPQEPGEIQGWVQFYPEDEKNGGRFQKLLNKGMVREPGNYTRVLEISYIRLPEAESGQVASAVRQHLMLLHGDINSRLKTGDHLETDYLITSYVDPVKDPDSIRVMEACGFEKVGTIKYDENSDKEDYVFVLNLDKLYQKVDPQIFPRLKS